MKKLITPIKMAICSLSQHDFKVSHVVNEHIQEYCCVSCGKQITDDIFGNKQELTDEYLNINKTLNQLAIKKNIRSVRLMAS